MKKSLANNAIYKAILNIFNLLVPLLVTPYISGLLTKEYLGMYNNAMAQFQVFLIVGAFGIYNYGVREISRVRNDKVKLNKLFTSLFLIGMIANILVIVFYVIYFLNASQSSTEMYVYMIMIVQIVGNIFYIEFINEANENYAFITKKTIIIRICYLVSMFIFVRDKYDVINYAIIVSITVLANNFASYLYLRRNVKFDFKELKIMNHMIPLIIALVLTNTELLYSQLDRIMLGHYVSNIAVTEYVQPYTLVQMVASIPLSLISVAIPRLSMYVGERKYEEFTKVLNNTTNIFMVMIVPISFGLFVLSEEIMWLYSKGVYTYAYSVLMVSAAVRIIFAYQTVIQNLVMYVNGLERQMVILLAVFGFVNLGLNYSLVMMDMFTPATAVFTTGLACLLFVIASYYYTKKVKQIEYNLFSKKIIRYFIVGAMFLPIAYLVKLLGLSYMMNIVIIIPLCIGLYGCYLFFSKDEIIRIILERLHMGKILEKFKF